MTQKKRNTENERTKRRYLQFLKDAKRQSDATVDKAAAAIERFDAQNGRKDFRKFHVEQAIAFKRHLESEIKPKTGKPLSKSTLEGILNPLRAFFIWLADQPGYRSRLRYADAEYFNLSRKDQRLARTHDARPSPSLVQVRHVLNRMQSETDIEKRDRAIVACLILTGIRDGALIGLKLKHVDLISRCIRQDGRDIDTKFGKTMITYFFPACPEAESIFRDWVEYLRNELLWGPDDPVFPKCRMGLDAGGGFAVVGFERAGWTTAGRVREIVKNAFLNAGLPPFTPHSFRHLLALQAQETCQSIEQLKAWSENLGHDELITTLSSYGRIHDKRRQELLAHMSHEASDPGQFC